MIKERTNARVDPVPATLEAPVPRSTSATIHTIADRADDFASWRIPATAMTLAGFREWVTSDQFPEKVRTTFVDGEIYLDMSKEDLTTHASVKAAVSHTVMNVVEKNAKGRFYLDGVLISNDAAGVSNNPDGVYLSLAGLEEGRFRLVPGRNDPGRFVEIEGSPDWVMEILSLGSVRKDSVKLRRAYFLAGIPEYWLIDALGDEVHFQILRAGADEYKPVALEGGWQFSATFERSFRLDRHADPFGWRYTLHMKSNNS